MSTQALETTTSTLSVSANEAAAMLGVSPRTLANWRTLGIGPAFVRVGAVRSRTLYRVDDLNTWLDNNRVKTTGSKAVAS
mgnify:FL=1